MPVLSARAWRTAAVLLPAGAAAAHIGPAATWLPGVRLPLFPGLSGTGPRRHIALTFDDGPDPVSTPRFLDTLDELGVRATFFVVGEHAVRHPELLRETVSRGHELGVHGWTHDRPWRPAFARDAAEVARTVRAVQDLTGRRPRWYRPPYGILTTSRWRAARRAGLRTVLWSAWGRDWTADATPASVRARIAADLRGGGTVLLHDSDHHSAPGCWRATLAALPAIVQDCRDAGLMVGPLHDHQPAGTGRRRPVPHRPAP
ncbi:polysaccharide deacetylase family protein [Streptomyces sp. NRRL B-3648]|uniref:polysaccharide deacetylase family protein n=1 Tax=Streptomyces sp. NRRL B-3648 TaxID=1519493 RepID=UPI0006AF1F91|nr:polysaccharide deacetylase family protein [Streptomyces sp. NRRL B-3648]KOV96719.1 polysaccharide deacetylase [Streptomyces sp. NRRL B-3648]